MKSALGVTGCDEISGNGRRRGTSWQFLVGCCVKLKQKGEEKERRGFSSLKEGARNYYIRGGDSCINPKIYKIGGENFPGKEKEVDSTGDLHKRNRW